MSYNFQEENKGPFRSYVQKFVLLFGLVFIQLLFQPLFSQDGESYIDSLTVLFDKASSNKEKIDILFDLVDVYENWGDWDKYEEFVFQALELSEKENDSVRIAEAYNCLGISNCYKGNNQQAEEYFKKVIFLNTQIKDSVALANALENLGLVYKDIGNYSNAVDCQLKSLELRRGTGHPRIFNNYMKLSVLYGLLDEYEQQDRYISFAKKVLTQRENVESSEWAIFYNELGDIYDDRGLPDSSIVCYRHVIMYSKQIEWNRGVAVGLGNLAGIFHDIGELDSSIVYHRQSLRLSELSEDCMGVSEELLYIADLFDEKGVHDSVMYYANQSVERAKKCDLLKELGAGLNFIASYQKSRGNYKEAYEYQEEYYAIKDSISSIDIRNNIAELETKYETKEKQQHIELLTKENQLKKQRIVIFISISVTLLMAVFAIILFYIKKRKQNVLQQETLKQQLLRSQMNPHFLFNALGSIQNYMYKNEPKKAAGYLNNFASLTRSILNNSSRETVSLSEEIKTLRNFLELEQMRTMNLFEYRFDYNDDLDIEFINVPPMFIQPFVENAIKHGFNSIDYKGELIIKIKECDDNLCIEVSDNGKGVDNKKVEVDKKHVSMAMKIFKERKMLLEKKFKKQILFEVVDRRKIEEGGKGTLIKITLPVNS